jgi:hypothetical protein
MSLVMRMGLLFFAAEGAACSGNFCDAYPHSCVEPGGGNAGGGGGGDVLDIDGVLQEGAILCTECAESPFCYGSTSEGLPVFLYINDPLSNCPPPLLPAQPSTRQIAGGGEETFFCVPPNTQDQLVVDGPGWCDQALVNHSAVDECGADSDGICMGEPCEDDACAPANAETLTLCGKDLANVGTPNELEASAAVAQEKIIDRAASIHGADVPGNPNADPNNPDEEPPGRYCFVTCFNESYFTDPTSCDPADDPWVSATATLVSIEPGSEATVTIDTIDESGNSQSSTTTIEIDGVMALDIPARCRDAGGEVVGCNLGIGSVLLKGRSDLDVHGFNISDLSVINRVNWSGSVLATGDTTMLYLDSAPALVTADVSPFGRFGMRQELSGLSGEVDWSDRTFQTTASFRDPSGSTSLTFSGDIPNVPPRGDAGPDRVLECTGDGRANLIVKAQATDADGDDDVAGFSWSRGIDGDWVVSQGDVLTSAFPLGTSRAVLTVLDSAGAEDVDGFGVTVVDSLAPEITEVDVRHGTRWPANGRLHLFRLGHEIRPSVSDVCDASPVVRIAEASGPGDVQYGDDAVCIRAANGGQNPLRAYTVTVEAIDESGNATTADVLVTNADVSIVVADNDPRCQ